MRAAAVLSIAALVAGLMLAGCAPMTRVVMLPQPGHDSVVEVTPRASVSGEEKTGAGALTTLLTQPYQTATVDALNDPVSVRQSDAAGIQSSHGALLAAQPPPAHNYLLYFWFNDTQITLESVGLLIQAIAQAVARPGNEIVVTGYTDSMGSAQANDRLSLRRAQMIRKVIIAGGFDPARVYAVGRGARDPLVPVGDRKTESRNRRVEITVR
jgi:outer membrane protein OmpA-like peptidoglycan-associated protein